MNLSVLKAEIELPLYAAMTDAEIVTELNVVDKSQNRSIMTGSEIWAATDATEYAPLTADQKQNWLAFCGIETHDPFGVSATFVVDIFGGGSNTVVALNAARVETVSRATILGLPHIKEGNIADARANG